MLMNIATWVGNLDLISPANNVPAIAIPAPTPAVVNRSIETFGANVRADIDTNSNMRDPSKTPFLPKRRASQGLGSASSPMSRIGMVVNNDAIACESENSRLMSGNTGPIDAMPGRRAIAMTTIATTSNAASFASVDPC